MSVRSRSKSGRWSKLSKNESEADQRQYFARPSPRITTIPHITMPIQEDRWPNGAFTTLKIQRKDRRDTEKTARRVYSYALTCIWVISTLIMITKGIFAVLVFLLLRSTTQDDGVILIKTTMGKCITDKEGTCFSKFQEDFFSSRKSVEKYWLSCFISEAKDKGVTTISQLQLPLFSDNPILLIIAMVFVIISYWILGCIYDILIDIANTADPK